MQEMRGVPVIECPLCGTVCGKQMEFCENCGWQLAEPTKGRAISRRWFWAAPLGLAAAIALLATWRSAPEPTQIAAVSSPAPVTGTAAVGETMEILAGDANWQCYASAEAFQDLEKSLVLGDKAGVNRALRGAHSINLTPGLQVKVIDADFGKRKVRVLGPDAADTRTGRECWVAIEALARGSN